MSKTTKEVTPEATVAEVEVKCYKFVENVQIGNEIFVQGECIKLTAEDLPQYEAYVKVCNGESAGSPADPKCKKC